MADKTPIEWTDATWNPIVGCSVVSPGCTNCYAMRLAGTRMRSHPSRAGLTQDSKAGPVWTGEVRFMEQWLAQPLRWAKPRMIFVCAHADLFHKSVPDEWIDRVFAVMALAPQHTFQVLTKRPERMREYFDQVESSASARVRDICYRPERHFSPAADPTLGRVGKWPDRWPGWPLPNVWLGVSVEDQRRADERIPILLDTPAAVRWVSAEPLLGAIRLDKIGGTTCLAHAGACCGDRPWTDALRGIQACSRAGAYSFPVRDQMPRGLDWVVAGGESGHNARPANPQWFRDLRNQCAEARVPYLHKQNGEWVSVSEIAGGGPHHRFDDGRTVRRVGKKAAGRLLDGVLHDAYPVGTHA
ncbi:phage Gp37/Gp68 family protein [Prosthecomicrobium hirschii]|uniref:phage Gp37/Gp68 family protein n=1 Tax=Prosthecodimorpha hirschii TaxID=665126 RepID=UPI00221E4BBC|nr:phage Gp37/Gp68 family protein [Prosthecomicrobium hirschii]MCW1844189.1 phage Gp37/Gp68 family protein [Prosthecomicrobium hirschii]